MKSNLSLLLATMFLFTFASPAFAGEESGVSPSLITYSMQVTQEGAKKFPYTKPEAVPGGEGSFVFYGKMTSNKKLRETFEKEKKDPSEMPLSFEIYFFPTLKDGKLILSGTVITYDEDGKFLKRTMFKGENLSSGEPFSIKKLFAAGHNYEVNFKFFY